MEMAVSSLPPEVWEATPPASQALIVALQAEAPALRTRLGQDSSNSSRPPSADPPQVPANVKRQPVPSGRKRGGQPGHHGRFRSLLAVEQVDQVVVVVPEVCRQCQHPCADAEDRRRARVWRHQVVELLPLAVRVTEYQMEARRCGQCGKHTRATLPHGVPRRPFGPRLVAVVVLLSGRYRLSRREVQQALSDLWGVTLSLGAAPPQEQAQSSALAPVVQGGPGRRQAGSGGQHG